MFPPLTMMGWNIFYRNIYNFFCPWVLLEYFRNTNTIAKKQFQITIELWIKNLIIRIFWNSFLLRVVCWTREIYDKHSFLQVPKIMLDGVPPALFEHFFTRCSSQYWTGSWKLAFLYPLIHYWCCHSFQIFNWCAKKIDGA